MNALLDLGLQPGERTDKFNANVAEGLVIRTSPVAGTEVEPGSTVDYVVSRGPNATPSPEPTPEPTPAEPTLPPTPEPTPQPTPATVSVPDVRGFAEADAVNTLLDQGLQPGARTEAYDPDIAAGLVSGTDPTANAEVDRGSTVDYIVSLGVEPTPTPEPTPALVTIPNLRGSNPDDAVNALLDLGLQPGERQDRFNANVPQGQVIRTIPDAGTEVPAGTTVDYRVSLGVELTPVTDARAHPQADPPADRRTHRRATHRSGHRPQPARLDPGGCCQRAPGCRTPARQPHRSPQHERRTGACHPDQPGCRRAGRSGNDGRLLRVARAAAVR